VRTPRSLLFAPGDDPAKLSKALAAGAGCVIADLEDAVADAAKERARATVADALAGRGEARCAVRVNALDHPNAPDDLALAADHRADAILVPKARAATLRELDATALPTIIAIVETAAGLQESATIAAVDGVSSLLLGSVDLGQELRLIPRPDGQELLFARSKLVIDSAAAGIGPPIDGVHLDLDGLDALRAECELVRSLGFGGKACIHPRQLAVVDRAFRPSEAESERARRIVRDFEAALADGVGVVRIDGEMVDRPVYEHARDILNDMETPA
jgi:citrate lyase beta subunit